MLDNFDNDLQPSYENENFEKIRKTDDIVILQMRTIYGGNRQNFLSTWTVFCAFNPPPKKIQDASHDSHLWYTCVK